MQCPACGHRWLDKYGKDECPKCLNTLSRVAAGLECTSSMWSHIDSRSPAEKMARWSSTLRENIHYHYKPPPTPPRELPRQPNIPPLNPAISPSLPAKSTPTATVLQSVLKHSAGHESPPTRERYGAASEQAHWLRERLAASEASVVELASVIETVMRQNAELTSRLAAVEANIGA